MLVAGLLVMLLVRLGTGRPDIPAFLVAETDTAQKFDIGAGVNLGHMALRNVWNKKTIRPAFVLRQGRIVETIGNNALLYGFQWHAGGKFSVGGLQGDIADGFFWSDLLQYHLEADGAALSAGNKLAHVLNLLRECPQLGKTKGLG